MPEVAAGAHDFGGEDDLVLIGDGLGVVALDEEDVPLAVELRRRSQW
jgi:hypothetical protein